MTDLTRMSVRTLKRLITASELTAHNVTAAFLERARARNALDRSYLAIAVEQALARAAMLDAGSKSAGLQGIPYACKDVFDTVALPTTAGSRAMEGYRPGHDAVVIQRLNAAGAVLLGKNNLHEFCYGISGENAAFGTPVNPHDPARIAGGSSSGSAVAVAQRSAAFAIGTDTGGSVRVPAALCGIVGLKPTSGRISLQGTVPFCWSLDHAGILARTCADAEEVLLAISEPAWNDAGDAPASGSGRTGTREASLRGVRIGVVRRHFFEGVDVEIASAIETTIEACRALGAQIIELPSPDMTHVRPASLAVQLVEAFTWHRKNLERRLDLYGEDVREGLLQGQFILGEHYVQALRLIELKRHEVNAVLHEIDVLLTPTTPIVAPPRGSSIITVDHVEEPVGNALTRFTCLFNLTGHPALSIPVGQNTSGLPIGLQLIGARNQDLKILRIGQVLEQAGLARWVEPSDASPRASSRTRPSRFVN